VSRAGVTFYFRVNTHLDPQACQSQISWQRRQQKRLTPEAKQNGGSVGRGEELQPIELEEPAPPNSRNVAIRTSTMRKATRSALGEAGEDAGAHVVSPHTPSRAERRRHRARRGVQLAKEPTSPNTTSTAGSTLGKAGAVASARVTRSTEGATSVRRQGTHSGCSRRQCL
jgi:hypothetical protein